MFSRAVLAMGAVLFSGASLVALVGAGRLQGEAAHAVRAAARDTASVRLAISGMTCGSCATTARIALERAEGVYDAKVSYDSASAVVRYDPERTSPERFIAHLKKMTGYEARVVEPAEKPKATP